jgi:hypothetical protein
MSKLIVVPFFFLLTISPTFAVVEFRDTTPMQICDTIIYNKGIVAVVKILSITDKYVTYKPCDVNTSETYTVKRTYINDIKSNEFPKASASYEAKLYKKKAKKALRTVIGVFGVYMLLLLLYALSGMSSSLASIILILAGFLFIYLSFSIIYYIYLWLKAKGKNQPAKVVEPIVPR